MFLNTIYTTERLILKNLEPSFHNGCMVLRFLTENKNIFEPYEPLRNKTYYTKSFQKNNLDAERKAFRSLSFARFYVFLKDNPDFIIGTVSIGNVSKEPVPSCSIGYKFDKNFQRQGYAYEAVDLVINIAFFHMGMKVINAFIQNTNTSSLHLIEKLGFKAVNHGGRMIQVNGDWKGHYKYTLSHP